MKLFIFVFVFIFSLLSQAEEKSSSCIWTDSSYASAAIYSKTMKASKGWIFCEESNLTSILLERYNGSQKKWIKKFVKESIPDSKKTLERVSKTMTLDGQKVKRLIVQVNATSETYDMVFFFLKKSKRTYVFSSILLERPYDNDLQIATTEVEKVIKKQPKLFNN